jgi:Lar family restriction alleviation protein
MEPKIKGCPFCGEEVVDDVVRLGPESVCVRCSRCTADGPLSSTENEAIAAWNNRPGEEPAVLEAEAVEEIESATTMRLILLARAMRNQYGPMNGVHRAFDGFIENAQNGAVSCDGCDGTGRLERGDTGLEGECGQCSGSGWHI